MTSKQLSQKAGNREYAYMKDQELKSEKES